MHLIEKYSLETGALIGNPEIYEKYYPCPIEGDYITNFVDQSVSSMQYDYWEDVVSLINPTLIENNIKILNLNPSKVKDLANLTQIDEKIEAGQVSYLIRNSLLHFGETSFCTDLASMHDVKIVSLYSMAHKECVKPYWGSPSRQILLDGLGLKEGRKPCYSNFESPKAINSISPEEIARSILSLLGFEFNCEYETIFTGDLYQKKSVEVIPNSVANVNFYPLSVRMDYAFNEKNLAEQINVSEHPVSIVTDKPINENLLRELSSKIEVVFYIIKEKDNPLFVEKLKRLKIPFKMLSYLEEEDVNDKKLNYMDLGPIYRQKSANFKEMDELKDQKLEDLYYYSNKRLLDNGTVYLSKAGHEAKQAHDTPDDPKKLIDSEAFWKELDCFRVVRKIT